MNHCCCCYGSSLMLLLIAFAACNITPVSCMAPPHPDYATEYQNERRRLTLHDTEHVAPELCHGLSHEECLQHDQSFAQHAAKTRKLIQSVGLVRTLVLCVRFTDHVGRELPPKEDIEALWNSREALDILPTGSISEYIRANSYNNFQLQADVYDWTITDGSELEYSGGIYGRSKSIAGAMVPVLTIIDALGADFSKYDLDGDGVIDSLVMLHSGYPAEIGRLDCTNGRSNENRIWAHAFATVDTQWKSNDGKYTIGGYVAASALRGTCGSNLARIGMIAHEFVHSWGIPDLYDTSRGERVGKGVGVFDLMSNPYGLNGAQTHPSNLGPWVKMQSGWLEPIEITHNGEYIIEASAINPSIYIIKDKFPNDEYILIENRQPIGWDELLWEGGLLIWHIDDNADNNRERGYPGQFGWPGNGRHYRVAISAGDRNYDLEKGNNDGDKYDFWVSGHELGPGLFEYEATDHSQYPNTNSYMFGSIWPTGIRIYDISQSDTVMTFKVEGLSPAEPPTPNPSWSPTPPPTPLPTWSPSASPTKKPTPGPTQEPSVLPTSAPVTESPMSPPILEAPPVAEEMPVAPPISELVSVIPMDDDIPPSGGEEPSTDEGTPTAKPPPLSDGTETPQQAPTASTATMPVFARTAISISISIFLIYFTP